MEWKFSDNDFSWTEVSYFRWTEISYLRTYLKMTSGGKT